MRSIHLKSNRGQAMLGAGALAGVGFLIMAATAVYVMNSSKEKSVRMSQSDARFINDVVFSRVGQAVAATAIICDEADGMCKWNPGNSTLKFDAKDFGFKNVKEDSSSKTLSFTITSCLPGDPEKADFAACIEKNSEVKLQLSDLNKLKDLKVLNWSNTDDKDFYGILISVDTEYNSVDTDKDEKFVSNAVIRRPRYFALIEAGQGECSPTCHVPDGQTRSEALCFGQVKVVQGAHNMAKVPNMTITNLGPGYMNRLTVSRQFTPNNSILPPGAQIPALSAKQDIFSYSNGLSPGAETTFEDTGLQCAHWTSSTTTVITHAGFNGSSTTSSYDPNSTRPTGTADYEFSKVSPANALFLGQDGTSVPSTHTAYSTIVYVGQN
ncbi:MAG: hypothetical protein KA116_08510 [Proteobacteria bacterium]|nr:hypothetical protein [Pseudomonadota bacterium]